MSTDFSISKTAKDFSYQIVPLCHNFGLNVTLSKALSYQIVLLEQLQQFWKQKE
jgi:hypothetical protein